MRNPIDLCNADLNKAVFKNVMFFALAESGAMGEPGGVLFYVKSGELYHMNYIYGDVNMDKVEKLFPVLSECKFGTFGIDSLIPEGWKYLYMGAGNHLIVNGSVFEKFIDKIDEHTVPSVVYMNWIEIANDILQKLNKDGVS